MVGKKVDESSKFIEPTLRADFFYDIASHIHGALDISDGLSKDLSRLSKINGVGFAFLQQFDDDILCSGEEYEILFTFEEKNLDKIKKIAKVHNTNLTIFAKVIEGSYENQCKENHF